MFQSVLDVLRNEKPLHVYFAAAELFSAPPANRSARRNRPLAKSNLRVQACLRHPLWVRLPAVPIPVVAGSFRFSRSSEAREWTSNPRVAGSNPARARYACLLGLVSPERMGSALVVRTRRAAPRARNARRTHSAHGALAAGGSLVLRPRWTTSSPKPNIVLSVVPPGAAADVAAAVAAAAGRDGGVAPSPTINAISPRTVGELEATLPLPAWSSWRTISGPPPLRAGTTRLYLSGPSSARGGSTRCPGAEVAWWGRRWHGLGGKMCTASVYKGTVALLAHALHHRARSRRRRGRARRPSRWLSEPRRASAGSLARAATKAERYVPEMREIAETQAAAGLPRELFDGSPPCTRRSQDAAGQSGAGGCRRRVAHELLDDLAR